MKRWVLAWAIASLSTVLACGESMPVDEDCIDPPGYTRDLLPGVIESRCLGCHSTEKLDAARNGAPADKNFDTYELAEPWGEAMVLQIDSGFMPPPDTGVKLTSPEKELARLWRQCGYKP